MPYCKRASGWLLLAGALLLTAACEPADQGPPRPDNLIAPDEMALILTDIHVAEARVSRMGISTIDSSNLVYKRLEQGVFKKFSVDTAAYTQSFIYYAARPVALEGIYKQVVETLNKRNQADSLAKVKAVRLKPKSKTATAAAKLIPIAKPGSLSAVRPRP
jgi:hypothetical protein